MQMSVQAKAGDLEAYLEADVAFHRTLLQASGNEMLAALTTVVAEVLAGRTHHDLMPAGPNPVAIRLHGDVAARCRRGDADAAASAMRAIIDEAATRDGAVAAPTPERGHRPNGRGRRPDLRSVDVPIRPPRPCRRRTFAGEGRTSGDVRSTSAPAPEG